MGSITDRIKVKNSSFKRVFKISTLKSVLLIGTFLVCLILLFNLFLKNDFLGLSGTIDYPLILIIGSVGIVVLFLLKFIWKIKDTIITLFICYIISTLVVAVIAANTTLINSPISYWVVNLGGGGVLTIIVRIVLSPLFKILRKHYLVES